jgi:hypothetical protein
MLVNEIDELRNMLFLEEFRLSRATKDHIQTNLAFLNEYRGHNPPALVATLKEGE